jgi:FkbM family methyltransferase
MLVEAYAKLIYVVFTVLVRLAYKQPKEIKTITFSARKHNTLIKLSKIAEKIFNLLVWIVGKKTRDNYTMSVDYEGAKLLIRPFVFSEIIMVSGRWEPFVKQILDKEAKDDDVMVDVGANIGIYAIPYAKKLNTVIAFEPHPTSSEMLEKSIDLNHLHNVELIKRPVGDSKKKVSFDLTTAPGHAGINIKSHEVESVLEIETIELDTVLSREKRIDWLLIDVNGFEVSVLNGARTILQIHSPKIIIELRLYNIDKVKEILTSEGYLFTNIYDNYYYATKNK